MVILQISMSLALQYTLIGIIFLAIILWMVVRMRKRIKSGGAGGCCGCAIKDSCKKPQLKQGAKDQTCNDRVFTNNQ